MTIRLYFLLAGVLLLTQVLAQAAPHRGVWFWNTTEVDGVDSPHSSKFVVGPTSGPAEDEAIAFMIGQGIKEVYGSYLHRPRDQPSEIWPWNAKLDAAGIESQLLISGFEAADPGPLTDPTHASLVTKVQDRLIDFNDGAASAAEQFDALHLDLEPQSLDDWGSGSPADKRAYLDNLLDAYVDIRAALDAGGYSSLPIYADIPFSWDKIPGSIDWASPSDRDAWFNDVLAVVDGLTIMTFSKDNFADLETATDYERSLATGGNVHVGIQPKVGPGKIWPTYAIFESAMVALETAHGEAHIENYAFWRHAYEDFGPPIGALPGLDAQPHLVSNAVGNGGVIILTGAPGYIYTIKHSTRPSSGWKDTAILRTRSNTGKEAIEQPIDYGDDARGFWIVIEEPAEDLVLPGSR